MMSSSVRSKVTELITLVKFFPAEALAAVARHR
jgi:hypothetical protein